jgi:hypothetical protein
MGRSGKDWKEKQQRQNRHDRRNSKRKWLDTKPPTPKKAA